MPMGFDLTEEQQQVKRSVREFAETEIRPHVMEWDEAKHLPRELFTKLGFPAVAKHKRKDVTLHRQGEINFIINAGPGSYAEAFARDHGPSACAMAFRVKDAKFAHDRAVSLVGVTSERHRRVDSAFDLVYQVVILVRDHRDEHLPAMVHEGL